MANTLILGGSGFLGRNIAKRLLNYTNQTVIVASRNPSANPLSDEQSCISEYCDVTNDENIMNLFNKYKPSQCINCVSLWKETPQLSFESVHKYSVKRIVNECNKYNTSLAYMSGLGLDPNIETGKKFKSQYMKIRCESERIIMDNSKQNAFIFRPGGIISDEYPLIGMLKPMIPLLYQTPKYAPMPLFGNGHQQMSLISVNNLAQIVVEQLMSGDSKECNVIELGNPDNTVRYVDLVNIINNTIYKQSSNKQKITLSVPLFVWWNMAKIVESVGEPLEKLLPLQKAQVELMGMDLIAKQDDRLKDFEYEDCFELIRNAVTKFTENN